MYAVIRRLRIGGDIDEAIGRANRIYARGVEQQVGFVDYHIVKSAGDELITGSSPTSSSQSGSPASTPR